MCKDPSQDSSHSNFCYARYAENLSPQICRDLYGDAMLEPIRAVGNQQKHLSLSFGEIFSRVLEPFLF